MGNRWLATARVERGDVWKNNALSGSCTTRFSPTATSSCTIESSKRSTSSAKRTNEGGFTLPADIVIGTPGRLKDLTEMGLCCLKEVSFAVLDEADRMLDMGFEPEVLYILG